MTKQEAILAYPMPKYVTWYETKFPARIYIVMGVIWVVLGILATALKAPRTIIAIPTYIVAIMLAFAACLHIPAWYIKRGAEKKRAKACGMTLEGYVNS